MPTISVCIVTYNSAKDIKFCLDAIAKQSYPIESIVVVDNASIDDSVDIVKGWPGNVQLVVNSVNNGFAGGQNQAIAQTNSEYVLILNPDVILDPGYLSEIMAYMHRNPSIGSATGQLSMAERPETIDSAGLAMKYNRQVYDLGVGEPISKWGESSLVFGVSAAAAVYRRELIQDISYNGQFFDETFFAYKEDVDVAWRANHLGWLSYYVPSAKALHRRGWREGGRKEIPLFIRRHSYQNRFFTLIKNEPAGWHLLTLIPILFIAEVSKLGYITIFEPGLLSCWKTIITQYPIMHKKRKWLFYKKMGKHVNF